MENASLDQRTDHLTAAPASIVGQACGVGVKDVSLDVDFGSFDVDSNSRLELYHAFPNMHCYLDNIPNCTNVRGRDDVISSRSITSTLPSLTNQPTSASNSTDRAKQIKRMFAHVLDMDEDSIDEDTDLGSLGFDSLSCHEVVHLLDTQCDAHLEANFVTSSKYNYTRCSKSFIFFTRSKVQFFD